MCYVMSLQIGDLKGLFGLLMVNMQMLRAKLKVLDVSYGTGTGVFLTCLFFCVSLLIVIVAGQKVLPPCIKNKRILLILN